MADAMDVDRAENDEAVKVGESSDHEEVEESKDGQHEIEQIVRKRQQQNFVEYLVKWKGVDATQNSWVSESEVMERYPQLVAEFREKEEAENDGKEATEARTAKRKLEDPRTSAPNKKRRADRDSAMADHASFENGDKVQDIVGARMIDGILHLYVMWQGKNICTFVKAEECNRRIPQKVIAFYESRLKFEAPVKENGRIVAANL